MCQVDFVFSFFDLSQRVVLGGKSSFYTEFLYNLQCLFGQLWISYLRRKKGLAVGIFLIVKENHAVNVCGIWLIFWKKTPILGLYRTLFERTHIRNGIFFPLLLFFFCSLLVLGSLTTMNGEEGGFELDNHETLTGHQQSIMFAIHCTPRSVFSKIEFLLNMCLRL